MVSRGQKLRLGIFLTFSTLALAIFLVYVAGNKLIEQKDYYYIRYTNTSVNGLQIGSSVKYHGVTIGQVDEFNIDKTDVTSVIITFSVKKGTPIKSDTQAVLAMVGITGLMQVELIGGSNEALDLNPGDFIETGETTLESITGKAESISQNLELVLSNLAVLTNQENRLYVEKFLTNISNLTDERTQDGVREFIGKLNTLVSEDTQKRLDSAIRQIESFSKKLNTIEVKGVIDDVNGMVKENRQPLNQVISNLDTAAVNLKEMGKNLETTSNALNDLIQSRELKDILVNTSVVTKQIADSDIPGLVSNLNKTVSQASDLITHLDLTVLKSRPDLLRSMESLKETADYLHEFSRKVSEDPSLILRSSK